MRKPKNEVKEELERGFEGGEPEPELKPRTRTARLRVDYVFRFRDVDDSVRLPLAQKASEYGFTYGDNTYPGCFHLTGDPNVELPEPLRNTPMHRFPWEEVND